MTRTTRPTLSADRRGVSEIIGAIFVFAILIMLLGIVQVWAVPAANEQTEFDHNQRAIADVQSLAADVYRVAGTGTGGSATVEIGARYDSRLFLVNPPAPAGSLRTEETTVRIGNVRALDPETADYVDGTLTLDSRSLSYRPNYHEYRNAPITRYEGWALYNDFPSADIVQGGRSPVSGSRISLVALDGRQSTTAGGTVTVPTEPVSAPMRTVSVTNDSAGAITLTLQTGLSADKWTEILSEELDNGDVESVDEIDDDHVRITLNESRTYQLRLAKVGIGPGATPEGAHYLTAPNPQPVLDATGGTVSVEVRDRFNNPVTGVPVHFDAPQIGLNTTVVSDEDGAATARFDDPPVNQTTITATAPVNSGTNSKDRERVVFADVPVTPNEQDDRDSEINPDDASSLKFVSSELDSQNNANYVDVTFENLGPAKTVEELRINAYISNQQSQGGGGGTILPDEVVIDGGASHEVGGGYEAPTGGFQQFIPAAGESNAEPTYRFEFLRNGAAYSPDRADFFVFSLRFDDGTTARYFVQMDVEG